MGDRPRSQTDILFPHPPHKFDRSVVFPTSFTHIWLVNRFSHILLR
jgi:hypothetical protein